ncbi:deleted in malignant brain tumors 1 protein-like [Patiria miniata]|uniref:SRCR domain-containing protein n=1 Tax=Patiria miniata TaxID=46514 RepID=A0A914BKU4_PATMI|nr:deleted in malignant brain tumors 1 protein-like [Patiria miniata]
MYQAIILLLIMRATVNAQDHDVRLSHIGGKQGRVEVLNNGQWGTVCRDGWSFFDALVVCKQLGFPWLAKYGWKHDAGNGTGPVWLSNVRCNGSETRLDECANDGWMEHQCVDTSHAAAVKCLDQDEWKDEFAGIFLADGGSFNGEYEGRVMVNLHTDDWQQRFLICDQGWDLADANAICRMKHLPSALRATTSSYFGKYDPHITTYTHVSNVSYLATDFACTGNESHIAQCPAKAWFQDECPTGRTAGVICNRIEESEEFQLRLVNGSTPNEGRVEVFTNGTWGSICLDGSWSIGYPESNVICRQLGFGYGLETPTDDRFGRTDGPVALSGYITCAGGESSFAQCYIATLVYDEYNTPDKECFNKEDSYQAGVICSGPVPESRSPVRTSYNGGGHVLIHHDGRWGTICKAGWTLANAQVVCRELGFRAPEEALVDGRWPGDGPIFLSGVSCKGDEDALDQCDLGEWYQHDCTHSMDVYVICAADCVVTSFIALLTSLVTALWLLQ